MENLQKALDLITAQQAKLKEGSAPWCVGAQLADILRECPAAAEVVATDLETAGMAITDAEKKIAKFASDHRQGNAGFCGPADADRIIREFYGIGSAAAHGQAQEQKPQTKRRAINIADFM